MGQISASLRQAPAASASQRVHAHAGLARAVGHALDRAHPDAHARKRPRPGDRGVQVDVAHIQPGAAQGFLDHGHEVDRVRQAVDRRALIGHLAVFEHRHARDRSRRVHRQQVHGINPFQIQFPKAPHGGKAKRPVRVAKRRDFHLQKAGRDRLRRTRRPLHDRHAAVLQVLVHGQLVELFLRFPDGTSQNDTGADAPPRAPAKW